MWFRWGVDPIYGHLSFDDISAMPRPWDLRLGVLGGSISAGTGVDAVERYSELLNRKHNLTIYNRAVGSTGCAFPSFCLQELLPASLRLRWLMLEYAVNDGHFASVHAESTIDGHTLDPLVSMERLLRRVMIERPETEPILLYVCSPENCRLRGALHLPRAALWRARALAPLASVVFLDRVGQLAARPSRYERAPSDCSAHLQCHWQVVADNSPRADRTTAVTASASHGPRLGTARQGSVGVPLVRLRELRRLAAPPRGGLRSGGCERDTDPVRQARHELQHAQAWLDGTSPRGEHQLLCRTAKPCADLAAVLVRQRRKCHRVSRAFGGQRREWRPSHAP